MDFLSKIVSGNINRIKQNIFNSFVQDLDIQKGFDDELEKGKWNVGDQKFYHGTMHYVAELKPDGSPRWRRVKKNSGEGNDTSTSSSKRSQTAEKPKKSGDKGDGKVKDRSEKNQSNDSKNVLKNIFSNKKELSKFLSETENKIIGKINMSWTVNWGKDKQECDIEIKSVPEGVKYRYEPDHYFSANPKRTETPSRGILVCTKLYGDNYTSYHEGFIGMNTLLSDEQDHLFGGINGTAHSPLNSRFTKEVLLDSISKNKTAMDIVKNTDSSDKKKNDKNTSDVKNNELEEDKIYSRLRVLNSRIKFSDISEEDYNRSVSIMKQTDPNKISAVKSLTEDKVSDKFLTIFREVSNYLFLNSNKNNEIWRDWRYLATGELNERINKLRSDLDKLKDGKNTQSSNDVSNNNKENF